MFVWQKNPVFNEKENLKGIITLRRDKLIFFVSVSESFHTNNRNMILFQKLETFKIFQDIVDFSGIYFQLD